MDVVRRRHQPAVSSENSFSSRFISMQRTEVAANNMEIDEFNLLSDFVFDRSTPESDEDETQEPHAGQDGGSAGTPDVVPKSRVIRRRARKACISCHNRKVRCDVISRGHTCTNCRLDGKTCVIRPGKRVRVDAPKPADEPDLSVQPNSQDVQASILQSAPFGENNKPLNNDQFSSVSNNFASITSSMHPDMMYSYYDFIEAETFSHIAPEDFKFLEFKGCFHLPARSILDEFFREYFLHIHPALPMIDERTFWETYFPREGKPRRSSDRRIPLFVIRAMLFTACGFVSEDTLRQLGYGTAVDARTSMYRRAKLLYDFDTTSDPMALCQGSLLLSYYCSDREPSANTSWLRLAVQYANTANVAMYDQDSTISADEKMRRKRLWWCIILRDRILPLGVRRSIQITKAEFDFSLPRLTEKDLEPEFRSSYVYDPETKRDLARVFVAQLDLAVELTDALALLYPINGFHSFDNLDYNDMKSMPKKIEQCQDSLDTCHSRHKDWLELGPWSRKHKSVVLYTGLTSIYLQSARAALCQLECFMLQADDSKLHEQRMKELGSSVYNSLSSISETVRIFVQLDIAKYLPVSAIAYLALPIILSSLDLHSASTRNTRAEEKRRNLRLLHQAMDLCKDRYTGTIGANNMIQKTIESALSEQNIAKDVNVSNSLTRSQPMPQDWFDVFISKPNAYLRISFTVDMSLATGRFSSGENLPRRLSLHGRLIPSCSIPQSLSPAFEDLVTNINTGDVAMLEQPRNSYLDFFDFGQSQPESGSDRDPWNGKTVDNILEEVLSGGERLESTAAV